MNYLAHAYLSYSDGQLVGNMIADFIRNRERFLYPGEIQKGIALHRAIDTFTDAHPEIHEAKKIFSPLVRLYAGAFVDVSFDFFLANQLAENQEDFKKFTEKVYQKLWINESFLPENFRKMLVSMEKDNWLFNYQNDWGIGYSMQNVKRKAKYLDEEIPVFEAFLKHRSQIKTHFNNFLPRPLFIPAVLNFRRNFCNPLQVRERNY